MELLLKRVAKKPTYTIGHLYVDGQRFCDVVEDTDRGLDQQMPLSEIQRIKVKDKTAIPTGHYRITLDVKSPKYSNYARYPWAKPYGGKIPRLVNVSGFDGILIHCLTPDTEILTENGWQNMESFRNNPANECYSYNMESGLIELVPIDDYIEQDYEGELYCNKGRRINYEVTDKHRMYVGTKRRDGSHNWGIRTADDIPTGSKFVVAANKDGEELTVERKLFYRLLMAVQADGYLINWSSQSTQVRFHFVKERKIMRVKSLLDEIGAGYKMFRDHVGKTHISLEPKLSNEIAEMLNPCRYTYNHKELPIELLKLKGEDLKDLLMEYLFFDGRWENYMRNNKNMVISSVNTNTMNVLQAMATCCGMRSYVKDEKGCKAIVLYSGQDTVTPEADTYEHHPYSGRVWCLSNRNTTLIVRKNNRPMVIGNCGNTAEDSSGCLIVGENKVVGKVINSTATFAKLYAKLLTARDGKIYITIQ